jgi:hypothetical protein
MHGLCRHAAKTASPTSKPFADLRASSHCSATFFSMLAPLGVGGSYCTDSGVILYRFTADYDRRIGEIFYRKKETVIKDVAAGPKAKQ